MNTRKARHAWIFMRGFWNNGETVVKICDVHWRELKSEGV